MHSVAFTHEWYDAREGEPVKAHVRGRWCDARVATPPNGELIVGHMTAGDLRKLRRQQSTVDLTPTRQASSLDPTQKSVAEPKFHVRLCGDHSVGAAAADGAGDGGDAAPIPLARHLVRLVAQDLRYRDANRKGVTASRCRRTCIITSGWDGALRCWPVGALQCKWLVETRAQSCALVPVRLSASNAFRIAGVTSPQGFVSFESAIGGRDNVASAADDDDCGATEPVFGASARTDDVAAAAVLFKDLRVVFGLPGDAAGDVAPRALCKELALLNDDRFAELRATPGFRQMVLARALRARPLSGTKLRPRLSRSPPPLSQVLTLHAFPSLLTDVDSNGRGLLQHAMHNGTHERIYAVMYARARAPARARARG